MFSRPAPVRNILYLSILSVFLTGCAAYDNLMGQGNASRNQNQSGSWQSPAGNYDAQEAGNQSVRGRTTGFLGPKGIDADSLNPRNMFAEPITDPVTRIYRLEVAVQEMRDDFDRAVPALAALIKSESELSQIIQDMKAQGFLDYLDEDDMAMWEKAAKNGPHSLHKNAMAGSASSSRPAASMRPAMPAKPPSPSMEPVKNLPSYPAIVRMRIGEHSDKTRIVLDSSASSKFSYDVDNGEKILLIEVPGTKWETNTQGTFSKTPLLQGYKVQEAGDVSRLVFSLKKPVKVLKTMTLKPNAGKPHRLVIDLAGV